ncbi:MAG TPA: pyridoxamine 5'-phosphate oxidase family protein [Candidatus Saccharimonadales bacterium]|nr:pyridoxamine 5'-phosphate oxidase family protein [Candidatus Saccharimonadales bacterium]
MTRRRVDELGDLLELPFCAVLSTFHDDGSVMLSPVWHEWRDGGFNIGVPVGDRKLRQLDDDPRATVVVFDHGAPGRGFEVRGRARISVDVDNEVSRRLSVRYLGESAAETYVAGLPAMMLVRVEGAQRGWDFRDINVKG